MEIARLFLVQKSRKSWIPMRQIDLSLDHTHIGRSGCCCGCPEAPTFLGSDCRGLMQLCGERSAGIPSKNWESTPIFKTLWIWCAFETGTCWTIQRWTRCPLGDPFWSPTISKQQIGYGFHFLPPTLPPPPAGLCWHGCQCGHLHCAGGEDGWHGSQVRNLLLFSVPAAATSIRRRVFAAMSYYVFEAEGKGAGKLAPR